MGAAVSTSVSSLRQSATTDVYQRAQNTCTANCNQIQSGNQVVLVGSSAGDIQFTQRCEAEASCYMDSSLDFVTEVFQDAQNSAEASPALFPGIQINTAVTDTSQDIKVKLQQVFENLCEADVNQVQQDNIVYATDSSVQNIGFTQESNASADCVMINAATATVNLKQHGDATASAGRTNSAILAAIVMAILVIFAIGAFIAFSRAKKKTPDVGGSSSPGRAASSPSPSGNVNVDKLKALLRK